MGPKFMKELEYLARENPTQLVRLIVRMTHFPNNLALVMDRRKAKFIRQYRLIKAIAIEIPAKEALELEKEEWVEGIEEDKEVNAM